jgi:hypothetical protein
MKTYKDPQTGRIEQVEDNNSDVQKALKELGYVEIDPETGEPRPEGTRKPAAAQAAPPAPAVPKAEPTEPPKKPK